MPTHQQRIKDITDSIEQGIRDLFASDKYTHYLRTMSRSARQPPHILPTLCSLYI